MKKLLLARGGKLPEFCKRLGGICVFVLLVSGCATGQAAAVEGNFESKNVSDFTDILTEHQNGVLANRDGEKLRTQIITFSFVEGKRVYFCTTSDKPLYAQLAANPNVSYCTFPPDFEPVLSLNGKVVFEEDRALKTRALDSNYYAKRNFKTVDNPLLRVFYIDVEKIETYGSEGVNIYTAK